MAFPACDAGAANTSGEAISAVAMIFVSFFLLRALLI
jgi:hypothetical protein